MKEHAGTRRYHSAVTKGRISSPGAVTGLLSLLAEEKAASETLRHPRVTQAHPAAFQRHQAMVSASGVLLPEVLLISDA